MDLEFHQIFFGYFEGYFFKELEYYLELDFPKFEYQKSDKSLHIFKTMVYSYMFSWTVVEDHFDRLI